MINFKIIRSINMAILRNLYLYLPSVPLNLSVELLRDTVILFSPHTAPFPPAIPIVRFVSESCLYRVCDASCFWELYCPRLSNDLFSVTVGKSALG